MAYAGKVAIVTGGASGIGYGILKHLVEEGARVVLADVNAENGEKVVNEFGDDKVAFVKVDVSNWGSTVDMFEFSYRIFGKRIDYVFANAGIAQMKEMRSADKTHFTSAEVPSLESLRDLPPSLKVIEVNLNGVLFSLHAALAYFRQQDKDADGWRGKFVATGSNASFYPFPNDALYGAAKQGVLGAVRAVGPRVLKEGITVNCFGPSVVVTALGPADFFERLRKEGRITPMKTITNAVDVFINPANKVTGHILEACGTKLAFRAVPDYLDVDHARKNMDEFWPVDELDAAFSVEGLGLPTV